ncbi:L-aspartate oxidase [Halobacteriovorax sp. HFRX-2_2]|uniref:L-aspartate oxidase n=1 Tax=unclassified Halobacteriovorax TaxID=2639665 RepID=UPI003713BFF0
MNSYDFDVLILGCGIAGLATAAKLAESNLKVGIVTRAKDPQVSNTFWAQGGIIYPNASDDALGKDIQVASSNTSNPQAIETLKNFGKLAIDELLLEKANANFERDENNSLKYTKEAAHSIERILYRGDYTGKEIQISLLNLLKDQKSYPTVHFLEAHTAIDLITASHHGISISQRYEERKILGAYLLNQEKGNVVKAMAKKTVLATGGVGALYLHHSNSGASRGDGIAMAKRAGADIIDMEFIQFHPTTFYDSSSHGRFLVSEAVRGEGGVLVNCNGERFMGKYHPEMELAPRDVVARSIMEETIETRHECVYLDISHKDGEWIKERFPTIYKHCLEHGIDMTKEPIPVVPAAHYTCGGVKIDMKGQTSIKNLYAVGEVSCSGLHGANRLASTSLLEGLTWGYLAAIDISETVDEETLYSHLQIKNWQEEYASIDKALVQQDWMTLKLTMWNYVGLSRTTNRLKRALAMFNEINDEVSRFYRSCKLDDSLIGLRNAIEVSTMIVKSSMRNKESIGCFFRKM